MKKSIVLIGIFVLLLSLNVWGKETTNINYTEEEQNWINEHSNQALHIGLAPYAGIDLFLYEDIDNGYLFDIEKLFEDELGVDIIIEKEKQWGEAYGGLLTGDIDILFGANPTEERLKFMSFTSSVYQYPYVAIALSDNEIYTIGDLNKKKVAFVESDMVIRLFEENYINIDVDKHEFANQTVLFESLLDREVCGVITSKTEVVDQLLYENPSCEIVAEIRDVYSEMTFSTLKTNEILAGILDKVINEHRVYINEKINEAKLQYMQKLLDLTIEEKEWIANHSQVRIGVPLNYKPIDYYTLNGEYSGVAGEYLVDFLELLGIKAEAYSAPFNELYEKIEHNELDILNMAKSEERMSRFVFTEAFNKERDAIYSKKSTGIINDIYGLEGEKVAIIKGFWHDKYLRQNLKEIDIVYTKDLEETLELIESGKADYFIETPMVAEFYIDGLGYTDIVQVGETSSESYMYFGMTKELEPLVNIFDRALRLLDYDKAKNDALQSIPRLQNIKNEKLTNIILIVLLLLIILTAILMKIMKELIKQKTETNMLKEREHLIYTDALTGLYNRMYFNQMEKELIQYAFPHTYIMMDLNCLKVVNDTYGHKAGDALIQKMSEILDQVIDHNFIMRMGGDEFFAFLHGVSDETVNMYIEEINMKCKSARLNIDGVDIEGPVPSIGYYYCTNPDETTDQCLHKADQAMYEMKKQFKLHKMNE